MNRIPLFRRLQPDEPFCFRPGALLALACHKGSSSSSSGDAQTSTQSGAQDQGVSAIGDSNQSNTGTYVSGLSNVGNKTTITPTNSGVTGASGTGNTTTVTNTTTDNGAVDASLGALTDILAGANNTISSWLNTTNQTITTLSNNATQQGLAQLDANAAATEAAKQVAQANQDAAQAVSEGAQAAATLGTQAINSSQTTAAGILSGNNVKYALMAIAALGAVMLLRKKSK
jgi:hypothetical protein